MKGFLLSENGSRKEIVQHVHPHVHPLQHIALHIVASNKTLSEDLILQTHKILCVMASMLKTERRPPPMVASTAKSTSARASINSSPAM